MSCPFRKCIVSYFCSSFRCQRTFQYSGRIHRHTFLDHGCTPYHQNIFLVELVNQNNNRRIKLFYFNDGHKESHHTTTLAHFQWNIVRITSSQKIMVEGITSGFAHLHPCSFRVYYYLFGVFLSYLTIIFRFLKFEENFVRGQNNSKYRVRLWVLFTHWLLELFLPKMRFWTLWWFWGWIPANLVENAFATRQLALFAIRIAVYGILARACAEIRILRPTSLGFSIFRFWMFSLSFFSFSFLFFFFLQRLTFYWACLRLKKLLRKSDRGGQFSQWSS